MRDDFDLRRRFWVFLITQYYPSGGLGDVAYTADTLQEVRDWLTKGRHRDLGEIDIFDAHLRREVSLEEA